MTPSAYDLYTFYLEAADLRGQSHALTIQVAAVEDVYNPRTHANEPHICVRFERARKVLKCNKTQVATLITISGTDDYTKWGGTRVILTPTPAQNGHETITITPQPAATEQA